jgi:hypothetical protein
MQAHSMCDLTDVLAVRAERGGHLICRDEAVRAIKTALRARSGRTWSVTVEQYADETWLVVSAPPSRRTGEFVFGGDYDEHGGRLYQLCDSGVPHPSNSMCAEDAEELAELLDVGEVHHRGHAVLACDESLVEVVARAEGRRVLMCSAA